MGSSFQWISWVDPHGARGILNCITAAWVVPSGEFGGDEGARSTSGSVRSCSAVLLRNMFQGSQLLPFSSACTWDLHLHSFTFQRDLQKTLRTQAGDSFPWAKNNSGKLQEHAQQQCSHWPSERALLLQGARETKKRDKRTFPQIKNHSLSVLVLKPVLFVRSYLTFATRLLFLSAWKITEILTHC